MPQRLTDKTVANLPAPATGNKKYYDATQDSKVYVDNWIASHAPGKVFLDYACGNGDGAIKAAKSGIAAVSKIMPLGIILRKLAALARPLLTRVLKFALNKLPVEYRDPAINQPLSRDECERTFSFQPTSHQTVKLLQSPR